MHPEGEVGVVGVLLAGGRARRMGGGDKCLKPLGDRTVLDYVIGRARSQVARLVLNANGDIDRFSTFGLPVIADVIGDFAGPLAGILTGLEWAKRMAGDCPWVASFATDTPFFPHNLVGRLLEGVTREDADLACAASGGRAHPVFGLWSVRLAPALRHALEAEGIHKIDAWTGRYRLATIDFSAESLDPFFNVNRPEDLAEADRLLGHANAL